MKHLLIFLPFLFFGNAAFANVEIGDRIGGYSEPFSIHVPARKVIWQEIADENQLKNEVQYKVQVSVRGQFPDISAYICDEANLKLLLANKAYRCFGENRAREVFIFEGNVYSDRKHYLVFDNRYALITEKLVTTNIHVSEKLDFYEQQFFKQNFEKVYEIVLSNFDVPEFKISFKECGRKNAFSNILNGNIILCSEIALEAFSDRNPGVVTGIILHELGHSFLNFWNDPSFTDEVVADEFALALILMQPNGDDVALEWASYFEKHSKVTKKSKTSRHPLNSTRAQKIKNTLLNKTPFLKEWSKILYPKMKSEALKSIIRAPYEGTNLGLAKDILKSRNDSF